MYGEYILIQNRVRMLRFDRVWTGLEAREGGAHEVGGASHIVVPEILLQLLDVAVAQLAVMAPLLAPSVPGALEVFLLPQMQNGGA